MIYKWSPAVKYADYAGASESEDRRITWADPLMGDPLPSIDLWVPPTLEQYLGGGTARRKLRPIGDSPRSIHYLISERAANALRDIWDRHAWLYPVRLADDPDTPFFMVVAKTQLDCLIVEKSTGAKPSLERDKRPFVSVHTWTFDEECVGDNDLFTLPDSPSTIFVSQRFKERVVAAGLKGFCLKTEFWEENPFVS